jgi:hypothetical protein
MALRVAYRGIFARNASEIAQLLPLLATPWKYAFKPFDYTLKALESGPLGVF